jgi:hypothetical protein
MLPLDDFFCHLMRRDGGRDENDLLQPECLPNLLCAPKVTQMDGIEGPAEETNPSTYGLLFNFSTLPSLMESLARSAKRMA